MSMAVEIALLDQLTHGPRDSRDVLAAMAELGLSPKQVRRARENLGIVIERRGNGKAMRSTWALPKTTIRAHDDVEPVSKVSTLVSTKGPLSRGEREELVSEVVSGQTTDRAAEPSADHRGRGRAWSDAERGRHAGRVEAFVRRGVSAVEAHQIASMLVMADREGRPAYGSCAQCANLNTLECNVSRPVVEMHVCWLRRCAVN